jgi:hypothetical protein
MMPRRKLCGQRKTSACRRRHSETPERDPESLSDGRKFFGGCIYPGGKMAVHDGDTARIVPCEPLYDK